MRGYSPCSRGGDDSDGGYHGNEKGRVIEGVREGEPPVDPSCRDVPLQSANGFCERVSQGLIEFKRIVCVLKRARCLNRPTDGRGNYLPIMFYTIMTSSR